MLLFACFDRRLGQSKAFANDAPKHSSARTMEPGSNFLISESELELKEDIQPFKDL